MTIADYKKETEIVRQKNDICLHCGASQDIHHYKTQQCPLYGIESGIGQEQEYTETTFEDSGMYIAELKKKLEFSVGVLKIINAMATDTDLKDYDEIEKVSIGAIKYLERG